jgi:hypothetical protein
MKELKMTILYEAVQHIIDNLYTDDIVKWSIYCINIAYKKLKTLVVDENQLKKIKRMMLAIRKYIKNDTEKNKQEMKELADMWCAIHFDTVEIDCFFTTLTSGANVLSYSNTPKLSYSLGWRKGVVYFFSEQAYMCISSLVNGIDLNKKDNKELHKIMKYGSRLINK